MTFCGLGLYYSLQRHGVNTIFEHDIATPQTSHVNGNLLQQSKLQVVDWLSKSPDLSIIEHVWDVLDRRVGRRQNQPSNLPWSCGFGQALVQERNETPLTLFDVTPVPCGGAAVQCCSTL